ncbi:NAD kinase [Dissostichus eleginoides]|uniref:NAD kinase n=1 Tax=Dissostichus eleginoides TaxID=100907 RepID=A0AAD9BIM7_DISEL|nr:NAD kinase [Dissostichus eleginoides]
MIIILSGDIGELGSGETRTRLYSSVTRLLPHPASCSARTEADRMGYRTKLAKLEGIKFSRFVMSHLFLRIPVLLISVGRVTFIQKVSLQLVTSQFQSHYSLKVRVVSHLDLLLVASQLRSCPAARVEISALRLRGASLGRAPCDWPL